MLLRLQIRFQHIYFVLELLLGKHMLILKLVPHGVESFLCLCLLVFVCPGALKLHFSNVPLGATLHGYAGLSYFLFRDGVGAPVELSAASGGERFGSVPHQDETGWSGFDFPTSARAGQTADVDFEIRSGDPNRRDFCFSAEAVE